MPFPLKIAARDEALAGLYQKELSELAGLETPAPLTLILDSGKVSLAGSNAAEAPVLVDFAGGALDYRRAHGGGRHSEGVARACFGRLKNPVIFDGTAGLGRDAFILASLGARVHLFERNPVVRLLLRDGLRRGRECGIPEVLEITDERMILEDAFSVTLYRGSVMPDTVYLDPMYPERKKSALVKKDMRIFHELLGQDADREEYLQAVLAANYRKTVMKLPKWAEIMEPERVNTAVSTKNHRFVVYAGSGRSDGGA